MSALLELAARCEAATGPDRELDLAIAEALRLPRQRNGSVNISAPFTASLDAAVTLVLEGWDWSVGIIKGDGSFPPAEANVSPNYQPFPVDLDLNADAQTPALALCAAALRARATGEQP